MRTLSNSTRSVSDISSSGETGGFSDFIEGYDDGKILIAKANSVSFINIFKYYGLRADESNRKMTCPFKFHSGGRERSASFYFYPESNTYHCFGCKTGSTVVDFVANMDDINKIKAAAKILEKFSGNVFEENVVSVENFFDRLEIMMDFSNTILDFRMRFSDAQAFNFIENMCKIYDEIYSRRALNNDALRSVVEQLKARISIYHG